MMTSNQYNSKVLDAAFVARRVNKHFYEVLDDNYKYIGAPTDYATIPQAKKYAKLLGRELGLSSVKLVVNDYEECSIFEVINIQITSR